MLEHSLQVSLPHLLQWRLLTSRLNGRWQLEQEEEELLGCRRGANSLQGDLSRLASSLVVHCPGVSINMSSHFHNSHNSHNSHDSHNSHISQLSQLS